MKEQALDQSIPQANFSGKGVMLPILIVVGLLLIIGGYYGFHAWNASLAAKQTAEIASQQAAAMLAIQDEWGIKVTRIVPTADGGLVDLRYQVTDPDKALFLYDDINNFPKLIAEDSGTEIALTWLPHQHDLEFGQTYFIIYRNVDNAIKPGGLVTVVVGGHEVNQFQVTK